MRVADHETLGLGRLAGETQVSRLNRVQSCNVLDDVGDAQALARVADLPLDIDRLAAGLVELAVDNGDAAGPLRDAGDDKRLAAILALMLCLRLVDLHPTNRIGSHRTTPQEISSFPMILNTTSAISLG